jgi:hypothetical protein
MNTQEVNFEYAPDWVAVSVGLGLSLERTKALFNDGRVVGRLAEFVVEEKGIGNRAGNENLPYDNITSLDEKLEIRSLGKKMSFLPSKEVGYGRTPTEEGFRNKLNNLDLFIAADYMDLDSIKFIPITKENVEDMERQGILTKAKSVNRNKLLNFLNQKPELNLTTPENN